MRPPGSTLRPRPTVRGSLHAAGDSSIHPFWLPGQSSKVASPLCCSAAEQPRPTRFAPANSRDNDKLAAEPIEVTPSDRANGSRAIPTMDADPARQRYCVVGRRTEAGIQDKAWRQPWCYPPPPPHPPARQAKFRPIKKKKDSKPGGFNKDRRNSTSCLGFIIKINDK